MTFGKGSIFQVGGCVRDRLLGVSAKDIDYVVVGKDHNFMVDNGFTPAFTAGNFPVYTKNGEEYALARREKSTGDSYTDFLVEYTGVTLEEDLGRRDLTMNAIAFDMYSGEFIDPHGGQKDILNKVIRHISDEAFKEDPLRVLRIARFLSKMPGFTVHKDTMRLCREMVESGMLESLTPERVSKELIGAFTAPYSTRFFYFLRFVGALKVVLPEIDALAEVTAGPYNHHPEGDSFTHTMMVLNNVYNKNPVVKWGALVHDLGKATTPADILPHHYGHEQRGAKIADALAKRLNMSTEYIKFGEIAARYHTHVHNSFKLNPKTYIEVFKNISGNRDLKFAEWLTWVSDADSRGRSSFYEHVSYPNKDFFFGIIQAISFIKASDILTPDEISSTPGKKIGELIDRKRLSAASDFRKNWKELGYPWRD